MIRLPSSTESRHGTGETSTLNCGAGESDGMTLARRCPECGQVREFYPAASTRLHLGTKVKWHCPTCDYGFVTIDDAVDSADA